jgi:hypothetical protein
MKTWWYMPEFPALGRLRQEDQMFLTSLDDKVRGREREKERD